MKSKNQKKAEALKYKMPRVHVVDLENNRSDYRASINDEAYVTAGSFEEEVSKLKRWVKKHNWSALDMFPVIVTGYGYGAITYLVRIAKVKAEGEDLKAYMCSDSICMENRMKRYDEVIRLAELPWPTDKEDWRFKKKQMEYADFGEAFRVWEERRRLIRVNPDEEEPDIETCIRVLKKNGYKVQKPVVTYEEV